MAKYHSIDVDIWEELLGLSPKLKLLYIYLFSCPQCRPSGMYKIQIKTIKNHTGCGQEDLKKICGSLIDYDFETSEVFVRGKFKRVLSGFKTNDNMRKSVLSDLSAISSSVISSLFVKKYEGALKGLVSPPLHIHIPLPLKNNLINKGDKKNHTTFEGGYEEIKKRSLIRAEEAKSVA